MEAWLGELRPYRGEGRGSCGWRLAKASWRLARRDRAILALAALEAALLGVAYVCANVLPGLDLGLGGEHAWSLLLAYGVGSVGSVFLLFAVASAADAALDGLPMSLPEALADARECLGPVVGWAAIGFAVPLAAWLLCGGVGVGWLALVAFVAWALLGTFVVPAMAIERLGAAAALRESVHVFRLLWRETVAGLLGLGVFVCLAAFIPGALCIHLAAADVAGHGADYPLLAAVLAGLALIGALAAVIHQIFAAILLREGLGDLPGFAYGGPRLSRPVKVGRVLSACVGVVVALVVFGLITEDDSRVLDAHNAPGATYSTVVSDPSGEGLESGSAVYYRDARIGEVLGSEPDGVGALRVSFHVEPGYGPGQTPGSFAIAGSGGGCPCLVLIPDGSSAPSLQSS